MTFCHRFDSTTVDFAQIEFTNIKDHKMDYYELLVKIWDCSDIATVNIIYFTFALSFYRPGEGSEAIQFSGSLL